MKTLPRGISAAMITLYLENGDVDTAAMGRFGRWLMSEGCESLLVFGTTGEGPSISVAEKVATVRAMVAAGLPPHSLLVGAGAPSLDDVVTLVNALGEIGAQALVLPPYFFRAAPSQGIYGFMDAMLTRTQTAGTGVFLYHFTEMSTVAVDAGMMAGLVAAHPGRMRGVKDSSGNLGSVLSWLAFPDFAVFAGDDHLLRPLVARGGAGVMTATAGLAPALVRRVYDQVKADPSAVPAHEASLNTLWTDVLLAAPVTETVKQVYADVTGDARWLRVRPPLMPLEATLARETLARFRKVDDGAISTAIQSIPEFFT